MSHYIRQLLAAMRGIIYWKYKSKIISKSYYHPGLLSRVNLYNLLPGFKGWMGAGFSQAQSAYTGWPKNNGTVDFLGLCSDQQLSFFTLLDRTSFLHYNNTKIIKFGWKLFILWVISYGLSYSGLAINLSFVGGPPNNGTVNFLALCSNQQLSFFTLLDRASFLHYNNTKIVKFGWKLFILWVISYGLSFLGFTIYLSSCLKTLEIGQIPNMTVHK